MCGIVGAVSNNTNGFSYKDVEALEQLLYIDALRGEDGTGIASFHTDGSMSVVKDSTPAQYFMCEPGYTKTKTNLVSTGKAFIGHNRKKTVGKTDKESTHPFVIDNNVLFVHNGTLTNFQNLRQNLGKYLEEIGVSKDKLSPSTDVDSHYLGTLLGMCGGDTSKIETVLGNVSGAYACVWIDQEKESLYILKNKERPLWLAHTDVGIFWSSEAGFLYASLPRNGIKIDKCEVVKDEVLYTILLSSETLSVLESPLTIKKAIPQNLAKSPGHSVDTAVVGTGTKHSSKKFKAFCRKWLNRQGTFYIDDFVERNLYSGNSGGFHVWGDNEDLYQTKCLCRAVIEETSGYEMYAKWCGSLVSGAITNITADVTTGEPVLFLKDIKIISKSLH